MEEKKSPKASLENKKSLFILIGLVMALSFIYIALEWTAREITIYEGVQTDLKTEEELDIIQTTQDETPPPPPPPAPEVIEVLNVVENTVETQTINIETEDTKNKAVEIIAAPVAAPIHEEDEQVIFQVVETMPQFPGGEQALFKFLNENIKYPVIAQENGIQGRVICQFVVNTDGSIVDIQVVRGVDPSLDKEAVRVIQSMPKWIPGKQRGKPVRVRFTLPINFKLQ
ncbi:MAG TPA: energy transducer TonB [Paludibacteraceae bacterium]|nr:energy transducer TonB [Paludibacteraceae bacterium]HOF98872.1 energy transducer TonB [Paludibacteraceae bacterium]HOR39428.1 energy transducer TonB [Paludibacteraceae bacterium]HPD59455.1 energy transducer TonB [Paludibacteraceae bacterium]HPL76707.1 energy transducer TonB [Paludibacteraceae bacterium]